MKFQSWPAFGKHLSESTPNHLSPIYLIIAPCSYERKKICDMIIASLHKKDPHLTPQHCDAAAVSLNEVVDQLNSRSLFGSAPVVVCDGLDKLKKSGWEPLLTYAESPSSFSYLILGSSSAKNTADLYQKGKKELVVLDLSDEKPWDRKARFQRYMIEYALKDGKTLSPDAAQHLLDHIGLDLPSLEQELTKLICYVGERKAIAMSDVEQICAVEKTVSTWQLSEMVVWESKAVAPPPTIDLSWLLPFLGQLRYQLQIGLQLAVMIDTHMLPGDMAKQLPQLRGALFDKRMAVAKQRGQEYFRSGLKSLFEIELLAKNSGGTAILLFDLLTAKLAHAR
ncbi:MAG: hypothetical protein JSR39_03320 [Verrucomicrobia bacterium]|nr:hypothetical protein [Verrucomicrobiota bacterium]